MKRMTTWERIAALNWIWRVELAKRRGEQLPEWMPKAIAKLERRLAARQSSAYYAQRRLQS